MTWLKKELLKANKKITYIEVIIRDGKYVYNEKRLLDLKAKLESLKKYKEECEIKLKEEESKLIVKKD